MMNLQSLRRERRIARRALSPQQQRRHSLDLVALLSRHVWFWRARRIALYRAADGEPDLAPLLPMASARRQRLYLPALRPRPQRSLWFLPYRPGERLVANRFGIPEPPLRDRRPCPPWGLDLILLPLVAFDEDGRRLGMGGGFYDRTLTYLRWRRQWHRPLLVGVAHECQRVARLPARPWDIPLDWVVTERHVYRQRVGPEPMPDA